MTEEIKPTQEERTLAGVCHLLSIPFPYLAPIMTYLWQRSKSRFVSLHAAQAFFETLILNIVLFFALAISLMFTAGKVWEAIQTKGQSLTWDDLWAALIKAAATWLILGAVSLYYTISSVFQAIQAFRGRWRGSLISGRLARAVSPRERLGEPELPPAS